jgi:DnaJ-class molecular chaperone
MSWTEEATKTCRDCDGKGGWVKKHRVTGEVTSEECKRCEGHGSIAWGADPGPAEDDRDWDYWADR